MKTQSFENNKTVTLSDEIMNKMSAKRLLSVYRTVRSYHSGCICSCGCGGFRNKEDEDNYEWLSERLIHIKTILDTKEHIERK